MKSTKPLFLSWVGLEYSSDEILCVGQAELYQGHWGIFTYQKLKYLLEATLVVSNIIIIADTEGSPQDTVLGMLQNINIHCRVQKTEA